LITHGKNGWLIEAASTIALKNAIEEILLNPGRLKEVGLAAMDKARQRPGKCMEMS
jgi:glycosyltransferase involved in cell wall biosynthesis